MEEYRDKYVYIEIETYTEEKKSEDNLVLETYTEETKSEDNSSEMKCKAYTKKNKKCKNNGKYNGYCKTHINDEEKQIKLKETEDNLLISLARFCIKKNFYRTCDKDDSGWFYFDERYIKTLFDSGPCIYEHGYMFLDEKDGDSGMIRLILKRGGNPKWSFWKEDGKLKIDYA